MLSRFIMPQSRVLLLLLVVATVPAILRLPFQISIVCVLPALIHFLPNKKWQKIAAVVLLLLLMVTIVGSYDSWFDGNAIMAFICGLLWLKSSEIKGPRDVWLIMLAVSIVTGLNALFGISLLQMIHLLTVMWLLLFNVMVMQSSDVEACWLLLIKRSVLYLVIALPFAAILFFMLPRVPGPLWDVGIAMGLPVKMMLETSKTPAITGSLKAGQVRSLQLSNAPVLVAEFDSAIPSKSRLYWRGAVFWDFDGEEWTLEKGWDKRANIMRSALKGKQAYDQALSTGKDPINYKVRVSPHGGYWLYGLDMPYSSAPETIVTQDYQLLSIRPIHQEFEYEMKSYLRYQATQPLSDEHRQRALQIPLKTNPRIFSLGEKLALDNVLIEDRVAAASRWYFDANLKHQIVNDVEEGRNSLDSFLFDKKAGSAEHLAGSFVMLMRAASVPSRLVTGYRGGNVIALTNFIVVKQGHAHVWLETWSNKSGWMRVDPKNFVAKGDNRLSKKNDDLSSKGETTTQPTAVKNENSNSVSSTQHCSDSWFCSWIESVESWVVHFDANKQLETIDSIGLVRGTVGRLLLLTIATICTLLLLYVLVGQWLKRRTENPLQASFICFSTEMERRGCPTLSNECPSVYGQRLVEYFPKHNEALQLIMSRYIELYYGGRCSQLEHDHTHFSAMVKRFLAMTSGR